MIKQVSKWVGVAAVALAASTSVQAQNVTLRFSNWLPPTHPMVTEMLNPWAKDVEQATEGRVKIQVLPPWGTPASHYDLVRNGVADMTIGVHSYTPERFKLTEMVELPMTAENAQVNSLAYWRTYQKYFMGKNEHAGTKLLGAWVPGSYQLWTAAKVDSLDKLDGTKIRIPGVLVERIAKLLGLVSISSTLTEAYDQISRGIIDGMFQNYTTVIDFNLARFMPNLFVLPGGFSASSQFMVVNERSWQRISEADRAAIDALSGEALVKRFSGIWQKNNMAAFDRLSAEGIKVHRIEGEQLEAMKTKLAVIEQQWLSEAKGVEAQEALNFYRAELDRVAAELGVPKD